MSEPHPSSPKSLPLKPNLEHLKSQAKQLLNRFKAGDRTALARISRHFPRLKSATADQILEYRFGLQDAQVVVAREYGFDSWTKLKRHVEGLTTEQAPNAPSVIPQLPVADVEISQAYYRDVLGFEIAWITPDKSMGSVTKNGTTIFFRRKERGFQPTTQWMYTSDVDSTYEEFKKAGAEIVRGLEDMPYGIRQFTIRDLDGHRFHVYRGI